MIHIRMPLHDEIREQDLNHGFTIAPAARSSSKSTSDLVVDCLAKQFCAVHLRLCISSMVWNLPLQQVLEALGMP